jgi:hypothetical protein
VRLGNSLSFIDARPSQPTGPRMPQLVSTRPIIAEAWERRYLAFRGHNVSVCGSECALGKQTWQACCSVTELMSHARLLGLADKWVPHVIPWHGAGMRLGWPRKY